MPDYGSIRIYLCTTKNQYLVNHVISNNTNRSSAMAWTGSQGWQRYQIINSNNKSHDITKKREYRKQRPTGNICRPTENHKKANYCVLMFFSLNLPIMRSFRIDHIATSCLCQKITQDSSNNGHNTYLTSWSHVSARKI